MYDICHPTYYNMSQLGCNDQVKLTTAFYVYMELCEVKRYWDVEYNYCNSLELFYLEAKKTKNANKNTFVPWPAVNNITLDLIYNIQRDLKIDKFTFVFKEGDTTSVYYSICSGIVKPIAPDETNTLKQREDKKYELEKEINRNTANLYERALSFNEDEKEKMSSKSSDTNTNRDDSMDEFYTSMEMDSPEKMESCESKVSGDVEKSIVDNKSENYDTVEDVNNSDNYSKSEFIENIKADDDLKLNRFKKS